MVSSSTLVLNYYNASSQVTSLSKAKREILHNSVQVNYVTHEIHYEAICKQFRWETGRAVHHTIQNGTMDKPFAKG